MSYWALNAIFLAVVALVATVATITALRRSRGRSHDRSGGRRAWLAVLPTLGILLLFTAVFDNVMIGIGLVGYDAGLISGQFIGIAPLEDFAYAIAVVILLPSLWILLPARREGAA